MIRVLELSSPKTHGLGKAEGRRPPHRKKTKKQKNPGTTGIGLRERGQAGKVVGDTHSPTQGSGTYILGPEGISSCHTPCKTQPRTIHNIGVLKPGVESHVQIGPEAHRTQTEAFLLGLLTWYPRSGQRHRSLGTVSGWNPDSDRRQQAR